MKTGGGNVPKINLGRRKKRESVFFLNK